MGVGIGDFSLSGHLDLLKTHFVEDTCELFENDGKANFSDATLSSRISIETSFTCWGAGIVDLDNDGYPDIFIVAGSVYPEVERKFPRYADKSPRILFRNLGNGTFEELGKEAGPAIIERHSSRGCAFGDFDNDGDIDILIVNMNEPPSLLRNDVRGTNHWLKVKLIGTVSNRSAIGARVVVHYGGKMQAQTVTSQSSFYSASDMRLHFGLGSAATANLDIFWPSGHSQSVKGEGVDHFITVVEGKGVVSREKFRQARRPG